MSRRYHYRPPPANHGLLTASPHLALAAVPGTLPDAVDLRPKCLPPRDQGAEGCCSGFATAALREALHCIAAGSFLLEPLSPAYLYGRTRMAEGTFPQDAGATVADEMTTLQTYGACPESLMPYAANPAAAPTPLCDVAAVPYRLVGGGPVRVGIPGLVSIDAVKYALGIVGTPVVFGMPVCASFETTGSDGKVPLPGPANADPLLGGHAMLCVGYDDAQQRIIVRNSWGAGWGLGGHCLMPYAMVASWFEAWTAAAC